MIQHALRLIALLVVVGLLGVLIGRSTAPSVSPATMIRQRQIDAGLDRTVPAVDFNNTPLDQAIDFLRKQTHANISVNWRALEAAGIDNKTPVSFMASQISLGKALAKVADFASSGLVRMGWHADDDGKIYFTTYDQLAAQEEVRVYDVRDLILSDRDLRARLRRAWHAAGREDEVPPISSTQPYTDSMILLEGVITATVAPESWTYTGITNIGISAFNGRLVIVQTPQAQDQIAELLEELRKD
jgi:hypothetical protein